MTRLGKRKLTRTNVVGTSSQQSVEELFNIYIYAKQAEGLAKNTLANKKNYFKVFNEFLQQQDITLIEDVTVNVIREMISYLHNDYIKHNNNHCVRDEYKTAGVSISYINSILRNMKAFFNFLVEENYTDSNPFVKVKQIKDTSEVESLTMEQMKLLLKQCNQRTYAGFRDYVLMFLLLDTGMRIGEAVYLKKEQIDFSSNLIYLKSSDTKNRKSRYVPFSQKTNKLLRELIAETEEFESEYTFTTVYGNVIEQARFRQRLKKYGVSAGIKDKRVSPHTIRHTFAKYYLLNDGDVMTLQKILGHSSLEMVRRYVQMTDSDIHNQHGKFSPINNL